MYSCHSQTMKPGTRRKKNGTQCQKCENSRLSGKSENFESFFIGSQKRLTSFGFLLCWKKKNLSHKFDFHNISKSASDPRKMENRMRKQTRILISTRKTRKSICKNRFRCENSCSDHHVFLPHSLPFLEHPETMIH